MNKFTLLSVGLLFAPAVLAEWAAGVATIVPATPYLGTDTEIRVLPIVAYEGERFTWRGPTLSYKLSGLERGTPSFSVNLGLAPNQLDTDDSNRLAGIKDRDFSFMLGATYTHPFEFATVSASLETDISNTHEGHRAVIGAQKTLLKHPQRRWAVNVGVELEFLSADYADYYYGVDLDEQSRSLYSQYSVSSIIQPGLTLGGYYQLNQQWNFVANLRWQSMPSDVKNSPIVSGSSNVNGFFGVLYTF